MTMRARLTGSDDTGSATVGLASAAGTVVAAALLAVTAGWAFTASQQPVAEVVEEPLVTYDGV